MTRLVLVVALALACSAPWAHAQDANKPMAASTVVNVNSATVPQLETLPGIGRATAERIVEYRQKNGPFKKAEDLMNVRGIGEKSFLKLKPLVSVGGTAPRADRATP